MTTNAKLKSICIFRLSAIGDVTHMIPVVKTLQHEFPKLSITWVIGKVEHKLLRGLPGVKFIVFDKNSGYTGLMQLRRSFAGQRFDALLQMQLSLRANIISRFIPAKRRIGFDKKRSKELHGMFINERIPYLRDCHVLDGFMQFADYLGCQQRIMDWQLPLNEGDKQFANTCIQKNQPNVVISPCSSHELRNWSSQKYATLADQLVTEYGAHVILVGSPSPSEKAFVESIENQCQQAVLNVAGKDTLKQLWHLLSCADLVISPDSGPLHMAGAVATPVIGLLAASNYRRSGSYQYPQLTVDKYPEACHKFLNKSDKAVKWGTKTEYPGAMDLIEVTDVMAKVDQVL
ncbi:glycosyltransferase family 9 protein [Marinicella sp. S1101]|uniref:glycosyltransferase family 9 protein n=1 Tax=Marinicella marina TaxID=2996016 RepID=UPI002260BE01|nr:glycosyltransferase family 9 protein [Marinicella marina]MCX7553529.1 glycosyltransferase family 9 protein [Marinicella marina]MDJ1140153.1 glycosyltransferase family 9 protein [Marinicella marina]